MSLSHNQLDVGVIFSVFSLAVIRVSSSASSPDLSLYLSHISFMPHFGIKKGFTLSTNSVKNVYIEDKKRFILV